MPGVFRVSSARQAQAWRADETGPLQVLHVVNNPQSSFGPLLISLLLSVAGVRTVDFAVGLWVLERSGSMVLFSLVAFSMVAPGILLSPVVGQAVDRFAPPRLMLWGCAGAGMCTLSMAGLYLANWLTLPAVALLGGLGSIASATVYQAFLAEKNQQNDQRAARRQGLMQSGFAVIQILAPLLASVLLVSLGIGVIFVAHLVVCSVAFALIARYGTYRVLMNTQQQDTAFNWQDVHLGWAYLRSHPSLLRLLTFSVVLNFCFGVMHFLLTPLLMQLGNELLLGRVLAVAGAGFLCGGIIVATLNRSISLIRTMLRLGLFIAAMLIALRWLLQSVYPIPAMTVVVFTVAASYSVILGMGQIAWLAVVPKDLLGRVFGWRMFFMQLSLPLGLLAAGPLTAGISRLRADTQPLVGAIGDVYSLTGLILLIAIVCLARCHSIAELDRQLARPASNPRAGEVAN